MNKDNVIISRLISENKFHRESIRKSHYLIEQQFPETVGMTFTSSIKFLIKKTADILQKNYHLRTSLKEVKTLLAKQKHKEAYNLLEKIFIEEKNGII